MRGTGSLSKGFKGQGLVLLEYSAAFSQGQLRSSVSEHDRLLDVAVILCRNRLDGSSTVRNYISIVIEIWFSRNLFKWSSFSVVIEEICSD